MEPLREQTNATEVDSPKTWAAHSLLRVRGQRENHGLPIRCITMHPSSIVPTSAETRLDIHCMYIPCTFVQLAIDRFLSMQNGNNRILQFTLHFTFVHLIMDTKRYSFLPRKIEI